MGAKLRVYRQQIKSVSSTKKITKAMELIAASQIIKAQQRVGAAKPYAEAMTRAVEAVAARSNVDHPLTRTGGGSPRRVAVVVLTADRGLAGAYNSAVLKEAEQLTQSFGARGVEVALYVVGRKGIGFYKFRERATAREWSGFSDRPNPEAAAEVAEALANAVLAAEDAANGHEGGTEHAVDEVYLVSTRFVSMLSQEATSVRLLPLADRPADAERVPVPLYEFEPTAEEVLDTLLPRYFRTRIWGALLEAAASEHAARRRAMKSASDNADELIKTYSRLANNARQAEITTEISEIVGGADALADANVEGE